jgi:hypothetical protein
VDEAEARINAKAVSPGAWNLTLPASEKAVHSAR